MATPLGHLGDITLRALVVLAGADVVACEDTRHSGQLLHHYGLKKKLLPFHEHNTRAQVPKILSLMAAGQAVALISDAGSPLIADPGRELLLACREKNMFVTVVPGAVASMVAWQHSGLTNGPMMFLGFLPPKTKARKDFLVSVETVQAALVCYEAPHRLLETLQTLHALWPERPVTVARELTKKFEHIKTGPPHELFNYYTQHADECRGEVVLVLAPPVTTPTIITEADLKQSLTKNMSAKALAEEWAATTGVSKRDIYNRLMALKNGKHRQN